MAPERGHGRGPSARIPVPRSVYVGLKAVQQSGLTNMLDRPRVVELALALGHPDAAAWVEQDFGRYAQAVFAGIRPDDVPESPAPVEPDQVGEALAQIAREELGIETLEVRGRDRLDFHDVGVAGLRRALERAYEMGRDRAQIGRPHSPEPPGGPSVGTSERGQSSPRTPPRRTDL